MRKKRITCFLLFLLIVATLITTTVQVNAASKFYDVPSSHFAYNSINNLVSKKIINGYPDGTFRPNNHLTREEAAKIIVFAMGVPHKGKVSNFPDVPKNGWSTSVIAAARQTEIINGYPDGNFRPKNNVTREEVAAMVAKAFDFKMKSGAVKFKDVSSGSWSKRSIDLLTSNKIINGYSDRTFRPKKPITRAEFAVFISKALKFDPVKFIEPTPWEVHVMLPKFPAEYRNVSISNYIYDVNPDTNETELTIEYEISTKMKILEMVYNYDSRSNRLSFNYKAQKTYQLPHSNRSSVGFSYKVMKNGIVVATGTDRKMGLDVGDIFVESFSFYDVSPGIYELVLADDN